ncbi:hypothetical protein KKA39_00960, partial [Patescibacteria group bacterium]|nr:hypothetical protein [Patescibacteria group bacterium]
SISCILVISFSLILVMTWDRWLLRIVSFIFLLTTFFVSKISNFEFSFMEAIIISVSMTVMPLLVTFIFYKKERMEKLRKRGYHLEPIEYLDGNFGEEILVLYGKDMDIIHVDKHYKEIL